jgi:hypothetical protein
VNWIAAAVAVFVIVGLAAVCWLSDRDLTRLGDENAALKRERDDARYDLARMEARLERIQRDEMTQLTATIPPVKSHRREDRAWIN